MDYRPKGALAKVIYDKFHNDNYLDQYDSRLWYNLKQNLPEPFQSKYLPMLMDQVTQDWLDKTKQESSKIWIHIWHIVARNFLQFFMTQTDINGFLKRGSMYILSEAQFEALFMAAGLPNAPLKPGEPIKVLDIGAGDGAISIRMVNAIQNLYAPTPVCVFASETSWTMRDRLKQLNFHVVEAIKEVSNVHLISCLNVLDRCIDPFELLEDIYHALAPNGRVILALVLPYTHYVEYNTSHMPLRPLMDHWPNNSKQLSFEAEATIFFRLLHSVGFQLESWTKAPYLCQGDLRQSFYWLKDLVVVLSKIPRS